MREIRHIYNPFGGDESKFAFKIGDKVKVRLSDIFDIPQKYSNIIHIIHTINYKNRQINAIDHWRFAAQNYGTEYVKGVITNLVFVLTPEYKDCLNLSIPIAQSTTEHFNFEETINDSIFSNVYPSRLSGEFKNFRIDTVKQALFVEFYDEDTIGAWVISDYVFPVVQ